MLSSDLEKNKDKYDCDLCRKRSYYKEKNCSGEVVPKINIVDKDVKFIIDIDIKSNNEVSTNFCPAILFYDEEVMELVELFLLYKDGFLLEDGGINNQPFWYVTAMLELKSVYNYIERKEMEKVNGRQ